MAAQLLQAADASLYFLQVAREDSGQSVTLVKAEVFKVVSLMPFTTILQVVSPFLDSMYKSLIECLYLIIIKKERLVI